MGPLEEEALKLFDASLAPSTHATYRTGVKKFDSFRQKLGLTQAWPAPIAHIVSFIAQLSIEGKSHSSINSCVSALSFTHKINGWADPSDNFIVKKIREGSRRCQGSLPNSRRPISLQILRQLVQILPGICSTVYEECLFRAAFVLAFFGFLRVGEFTAKSKNAPVHNILSIADVSFSSGPPQHMEVTIRYSKTDQRGRSTTLHFTKGDDISVCPIMAVARFVEIRPTVPGPLFVHFGGDPLTRYQFNALLKKGISAIGLSPSCFSPHSFRIGAATAAASNGVPIDVIKNMGRWQSHAVKLYIRPHRVLSLQSQMV